jgi:hypothetical protein
MEISSAGIMTAAVIAFTALSIGGVQAAPTTVAGVVVGGPGEKTQVFSDLSESFVTPQNPLLFGFGRVTRINNLAGNAFCASGNCELTYVYRDYVPIVFNVGAVESNVVFTGGSVDFYLDSTPDASLVSGTGFDDSDTGSPWLSLIGSESTKTTGPNAGLTGTLFSVVTDPLDPQKINGSGEGLLRVTGGAAAAYFGLGNVMSYISAVLPSPAGYALPLAGPTNLEIVAGNTPLTVPEPGPLAMLGIGLIGLMRLSRATTAKLGRVPD